jgi:hypothetical protein
VADGAAVVGAGTGDTIGVVDGTAVVEVTDGGITTVEVAADVSDVGSSALTTSTRPCEHDASKTNAINNARPP